MPNLAAPREVDQSTRTMSLVRTWFIVLAFLYFANGGGLNFTDTPAGAGSGAHQAGLLLVCLISTILVAGRWLRVANSILRRPLMMLLPALALLSTLWSSDPRQTLVSAITLISFTLFAYYLVDAYDEDGLLDLVMLTGAVAVIASILAALLVPSFGLADGGGWRGIFAHKQQCAAVTTLFLITALHWRPAAQLHRVFRAFFIPLCVLLIAMSQSRTGWLLALIALGLSGFLLLLHRFRRPDAFFLLAAAIPVTVGLIFLLSLGLPAILASIGKDSTLSQRTIIWAAVWDAIQQRPLLGYGYEAFWKGLAGDSERIVLISGWNVSQAQSGYLDLWLQFGISGIVTIVLVTARACADIVAKVSRRQDDRFIRWCIVILACNLLYNIGESDFAYLKMLYMSFLIVCLSLDRVQPNESLVRDSTPAANQVAAEAHSLS